MPSLPSTPIHPASGQRHLAPRARVPEMTMDVHQQIERLNILSWRLVDLGDPARAVMADMARELRQRVNGALCSRSLTTLDEPGRWNICPGCGAVVEVWRGSYEGMCLPVIEAHLPMERAAEVG